MTDNVSEIGNNATLLNDDVVQPFRLEKTSIRGRVVRMGSVLQDIINRHDYPAPVSYLLSEAVTVCILLSAMLKYDGIFTLQIKGNGPIQTLVVDATTDAKVRGYASFDEEAVKKLAKRKPDTENNYFHLLGEGYVSFTVDQQLEGFERYQGIVELQGGSLAESVNYYFKQSEQIKTEFKLDVHPQDAQWRAAAIMVQHMPSEGGDNSFDEITEEDWNRTSLFLQSCKEQELLSPNLTISDLLYRLFHEEGVRIYDQMPVQHVCRCSREKVENVIMSLPKEEIDSIIEERGQIDIDCEFCSRSYSFTQDDVDSLSS